MRIVLSGQRTFGRLTLELLRKRGDTILAVSAPPHQPGKLDRLRAGAEDAGLPIITSGSLNSRTCPPADLLIAAHSHDYISRKVRNRLRLGALGYHPSLLPIHRGRDAVRWSIRQRERVTGGTVFWLNDTVDGGPIAAQRHVLIEPDEDAGGLWRRALQPLGIELLAQTLAEIDRGVLRRAPQDPRLATWEPSIDQPPLHRPDLPELGNGGWTGYRVLTDLNEADREPRPITPADDEYWIGATELDPRPPALAAR